MRFYGQPETKSCLGLTNLKVGTRFLLFKNTQIEKTVKKSLYYNDLSTKANK